MPTLLCWNEIKKLLRSAIDYPDQRLLVEYVNSQDSGPSWDSTLINVPELRRRYWQAVVALGRELAPQHIGSEDIYMKLWQLFREVVLNSDRYQTRQSLDQKLSEFSEEVKKPLQTFDIVFEIKNFDVGGSSFYLGNVEIFKLTKDYLGGLGLGVDMSVVQDNIFEKWVGRSVAKTEVSVSDIHRAYEAGASIVNGVLDTLRLAAITEGVARFNDEVFRWELGESISIPKVKPESGTRFNTSSRLGFRPIVLPMDQTVCKGLEDQKSWQYVLDGNLPEDISHRIKKAIKWMSHAVTSSSLDHKIVALCIALEILLLPHRRSSAKGELIALRQLLVGGRSGLAPEAILCLYKKRSNIIHSGALEITSYSDYRHLLIC